MIETSLIAWGWLGLAFLLSSHAMLRLSGTFPWSQAAHQAQLPFFFGLALAPFFLGFVAILALVVADSASHGIHRMIIYGTLAVANILALRFPLLRLHRAPYSSGWEKTAAVVLALFLVALVFNTLFYPLTQNDPLEYATVGRALFRHGSLSLYPLIDPQADASGFYAPWTHPPLYVVMIYVTELMQNHANAPGLMRLISPWFALTTLGVIFALGSLVSRRTGIFACLIMMAVPLFFLGAGAAVIDTLAILGFTLIIAATMGIQSTPFRKGLLLGVVTGIALWTHSQAVLFVPLALAGLIAVHGLRAWRIIIVIMIGLLLVALPIAAWPFWHNLHITGALISDEPLVFALPSLDWDAYFRLNRGIDSVTSIIQYGVFKGWFAPVSFSAVFWLMSIAIGYYFTGYMRWRRLRQSVVEGPANAGAMLPWVSMIVIAAYLGGVILSVLLGIDLMIRNERYMLVIMPFVALIGGWFLDDVLHRPYRYYIAATITAITLVLLALHVPVYIIYSASEHNTHLQKLIRTREEILKEDKGYKAAQFLKEHTPEDALVLTIRPADMYYTNRRMMTYLDPRLTAFYESTDKQKAWQLLKKLGIDYIHVPDYPLPPLYRGMLQEILADASLTELVFSESGYQVYRLNAKPNPVHPGESVSLTDKQWVAIDQWILGGRKPLYRIRVSEKAFDPAKRSVGIKPLRLWQRDFSTVLQTEAQAEFPQDRQFLKVEPNSEYTVDLILSGYGYIEMFVMEYDQYFRQLNMENGARGSQRVSGTVLAQPDAQHLVKRIRTLPETHYLVIGLEHYGNSNLKVERGIFRPVNLR